LDLCFICRAPHFPASFIGPKEGPKLPDNCDSNRVANLRRSVPSTQPEAKPTLKQETRDAILLAIAKARSWIDDIPSGRVQSIGEIAEREGKVERQSGKAHSPSHTTCVYHATHIGRSRSHGHPPWRPVSAVQLSPPATKLGGRN
jgi:hypothetical protein